MMTGRAMMKYSLALAGAALLAAEARARTDVMQSELQRIQVIAKVKPTVVAIFARGGQGGGTGVLVSADGYALTNFHVVQPCGPTMQCGLPDGILYDAVLVGLDKVGDVALIKLLPKKEGERFPYAALGDSDTVREGQWSLAMGNPFLLATDFTPTITFGLVSGVHRYQYPAGILLEYTDCIQTDASINPGNSGGPLFNMKGELIGINGRGSFDKRGRVNSGVGYAISINQIKNFMGHLRAGLDSDHASLGAIVKTQTEQTGLSHMTITSMLEESDIARRGIEPDDELVSFSGRPVTSVNHYRNILGIYPRGGRVPLEYRREGKTKEALVRLMGVQRKVLDDPNQPFAPQQPPRLPGEPKPDPKKPIKLPPTAPQGPAAKFYEARPAFANYYFNRLERDRLLADFRKVTDASGFRGDWALEGDVRLLKARTSSKFNLDLVDEKEADGSKGMVYLKIDAFPYKLEPLRAEPEEVRVPQQSGGVLAAMFVLRHFLTQGVKGFSECNHGGYEPCYPPAREPSAAGRYADVRVDAEVLNSRFGPFLAKWFFHRAEHKLIAFELRLVDNEDPCEVYLDDYRVVEGQQLPHRITVMYQDVHYGTFAVSGYKLKRN
jgi:serine protease Do